MPEAARHMGTFHWLNGRAKKATRWWNFSLKEAAETGQFPDQQATQAEMDKRMSNLV
jgi:hypothetical protein